MKGKDIYYKQGLKRTLVEFKSRLPFSFDLMTDNPQRYFFKELKAISTYGTSSLSEVACAIKSMKYSIQKIK